MFIWIALMVLIVFLDQLSKYLTVLYLKPVGTCPIIEDAVHLTYVENQGAAFGILTEHRWVFLVVSTVAIAALLFYLFKYKPKSRMECTSLSFIVAGGIGNMIDRVALGYVVDMIDFRIINFAVFNVADSFVCIGAGLLMLWIIVSSVKEAKAEKAKKAAAADGEASVEAPADEETAPADETSTDETPVDEETAPADKPPAESAAAPAEETPAHDPADTQAPGNGDEHDE